MQVHLEAIPQETTREQLKDGRDAHSGFTASTSKVDELRPSDPCVSDLKKAATTEVSSRGPNRWWKYK